MTRYVKGDNVELAGQSGEGREWERNTELQYVFQSGALKNLGIRWRNATFRSNFTRDIDENRLIVSYTPADLVSQNKNSTGAPMMMKLSFRPSPGCRRPVAGRRRRGRTQAS